MQITFNQDQSLNSLSIALAEGFDLDQHTSLDEELKSLIIQTAQIRKFEGKAGQIATMMIPHKGIMKQIILLGVGKHDAFNNLSAIKLGGRVIAGMKCVKFEKNSVMLEQRLTAASESEVYANVAYGASLRNYSFDKYKSADKLKDKVNITQIELVTKQAKEAEAYFIKELKPVAEAIHFSRNLISEPPNVIYPESFAEHAKDELTALNIKVEILDEAMMRKLGMNSLLGVGQGSSKESRLLVLQYNGGTSGEAPIAFVGKGVTFDSGGISLKPALNMEDMKHDMSGAAVVTGLIRALAQRKAKVNIVAIAGLVENMPDGNAQRPADVVKSMSGQTIEVINTDAEGRLVLADALWYTQNRFKPKLMIDLATLTGAVIVALGRHNAGLFSNDDELATQLLESAKTTQEKLWQLPLSDEYDQMIDSKIADMLNSAGGGAGSVTAAQFLKRFVNDVKWAHLDIAGVSWADKDSDLSPTGATGFGIRLLDNFVRKHEK